jgi:hypothetical protein
MNEERLERLQRSCGMPNWDGYGAAPLSDIAVESVRQFMAAHLFPTPSGGLNIDASVNDVEVEIEFDAEGRIVCILAEDKTGRLGAAKEFSFGINYATIYDEEWDKI